MPIGHSLVLLQEPLETVPPEHAEKPFLAHDLADILTPKQLDALHAYSQAYFGTTDIPSILHNLPAAFYGRLSANHAAQAMLSVRYSIGCDAEREIEKDPVLRVVRKISSSQWRWGHADRDWNDIVSAYRGIAAFDLGIDGFEVRLDHTTGYNEKGRSEHAGIFLDGVFGFLVHWKGKHVMTIGFSISKGRVLLQQVQAVSRTGNRWMFRMPANRMEFVIDRLSAAFPDREILIGDGSDYAGRSLSEYRSGLEDVEGDLASIRKRIAEGRGDSDGELARREEQRAKLSEKIEGLRSDMARIDALYRETGRWTRGKVFKANGMRHYALAA